MSTTDVIKGQKKGLFHWLRVDNKADEVDEAAASVSPVDLQGELERRLVDEGEIARGGMGSIRRVHDMNLLRRLAMKVLDPKVATDEIEAQRFLEEAQITGQLEHPNIPPVHEVGSIDATQYFTMKLVKGKTLEQILVDSSFDATNDDRLAEALKIVIKVCEAVSYAHSKGVVHCDLKPANIMSGTHGQVYVMDWGIARLTQAMRISPGTGRVRLRRTEPLENDNRIVGTLSFMAPEQARGKVDAIDARTDVFALGAILYRIIAGRPPYKGANTGELWEQAQKCQIDPPEKVCDHRVQWKLSRTAMKALNKDPTHRHQTVEAFQKELEDFLRGAGHHPTRNFQAGDTVINEGDPGDAAFVIAAGRARAFKTVDGRPEVLREMAAGEVFGEAALLSGGPRTASVEAIEPLTVIVLDRATLQEEFANTYWVSALVKTLAKRFTEVDSMATDLGRQARSAEVCKEAAMFLALEGAEAEPGVRQGAWSLLLAAVAKRTREKPDEAQRFLEQMPGLSIDLAGDRATLKRA